MSDSITIARPYAKAIFEYANAKRKLSEWSCYLQRLSMTVMDSEVINFISNPASLPQQHSDLLLDALNSLDRDSDEGQLINFIKTLAENKRITLLPDITSLFEDMRALQEKTLSVDVFSYSELSPEQQTQLVTTLSERLHRQVTLNITIDKTLIGGALINAGDLVIDGTVRGKLEKLRTGIAA
jgi:F-type H+-transporting ATPase subunit delta